jgi:hypothetical protein
MLVTPQGSVLQDQVQHFSTRHVYIPIPEIQYDTCNTIQYNTIRYDTMNMYVCTPGHCPSKRR